MQSHRASHDLPIFGLPASRCSPTGSRRATINFGGSMSIESRLAPSITDNADGLGGVGFPCVGEIATDDFNSCILFLHSVFDDVTVCYSIILNNTLADTLGAEASFLL